MRPKTKRWKLFWLLLCTFQMLTLTKSEGVSRQIGAKGVIYPRMDYNQWKPLGHGDPLKDDPTFDYVPPVFDHVHYWEEISEEGTPKPSINQTMLDTLDKTDNKTEILLLGVSSKKPAVQTADKRKDIFGNYPTYADLDTYKYNSKFYENQRIARPSFFPSMSSSVLPSLMHYASKIFDRAAHSKDTQLREPYTILVPPPIKGETDGAAHHYFLDNMAATPPTPPLRPLGYTSSTVSPYENNYITSTPSVTIEESNLIYHSSSLSNQDGFTSEAYLSSAPSINWQLPSTTHNYFDSNAKMQAQSQHFVSLNKPNLTSIHHNLIAPDSTIRVKFSNNINFSNKPLDEAGSDDNVNYVTAPSIHKSNMLTPPPMLDLDKPLKFKAHVSDDHEISNIYVKIEKPQAQMHSTGVGVNMVPTPVDIYPDIITHPQINMQTIKDMQTLKPPAPSGDFLSQNPIFIETGKPLLSILKKEVTTHHDLDKFNFIASESMITNAITAHPYNSSSVTINTDSSDTTTQLSSSSTVTTEAPLTTSSKTLTTDPLFKHYKQPLDPVKDGPLYLIIQGHSKVKTYKPAKQINGIMIQESNEIPNSDTRYKHVDFDVKHLHHIFKTVPLEDSDRQARSRNYGNLDTLKHIAQTGYGKIDFESEAFTEPMIKSTSEMIERVLSTMQPQNYNINYNANRMINEVKGVPKELFEALNDLRNSKKDFKNVVEMLTEAATRSMHDLDTTTGENSDKLDSKEKINISGNDIQETQLSSQFEVGNVEDTSSERYHKGIVEAARKLKL